MKERGMRKNGFLNYVISNAAEYNLYINFFCFGHYKIYTLMKNLSGVLLMCLLALLMSQAFTQDQTVKGEEFKDPEFVKVLNNYFGCKTWEDGVCVECSARFVFNDNGVCCEIKPQCEVFNRAVGICEKCYQGYGIVDGSCVRIDLVNSDGQGCRIWNGATCIECSSRWTFNANGVCQKVSDLCRTWTASGNCETCYGGYIVEAGACVKNPQFVPAADNLCKIWTSDRVCLECANRAVFD